MRIRYHGHACVSLTASNGACLLVDPYQPGGFGGKMRYPPIVGEFVGAVCTHDHLDHSDLADVVPPPPLVHDGVVGPFSIERRAVAHDEYDGLRRGGFTDVLTIACDQWTLMHLGDVGQAVPHDWPITCPDILFVPVGGFFTIGAFQAIEWIRRTGARCAIPIHYRTPQCDLPIRGIETFLALVREYNRRSESYIDVEVDSVLPRVLVLDCDARIK
ncbi:MAG: MBL fold metallo-hydrolase [bacterium]